jgi:hypothetical protein
MATQTVQELGLCLGRHKHRTKGSGPSKQVPFTGFEVLTEGGMGDKPHLRIPLQKQANGQIGLHYLAFRSGIDLKSLMQQHLPSDTGVAEALSMTREGPPLYHALMKHEGASAVRRDLARTTGFSNHLSEVVAPLAACIRSLSSCIYEGSCTRESKPTDNCLRRWWTGIRSAR